MAATPSPQPFDDLDPLGGPGGRSALLRFREWLFPSDEPVLERRMFRGITLVASLVVGIVVLPVNYFQGLPWLVNGGATLFAAGCLVCYLLARRGIYAITAVMVMYMLLLDALWFGNAGSQGPTAMYFFLGGMYIVAFYRRLQRWLMGLVLLGNGLAILLAERFHPEWVFPYPDPSTRWLDFLTSFAVCILVTALLVSLVIQAHSHDRVRLHRAMAEVRANEQRYLSTFQFLPYALAISDLATGKFIDINEGFQATVGYSRLEVVGRTALELGLWADPEERAELVGRVRTGERVRNMPMRLRRKDGSVRWQTFSAEQITLSGRPVLLSTTIDTTELQEAEAATRAMEVQLLHLQRLESIGRLAGGVAHDMNNVLAAILAVTAVLEKRCAHEPASLEELHKIQDAAIRGRDLVRGLTDFARKDLHQPEPVDLNELARSEARLLESTTLKRVDIRLDLEDDLPTVQGERSALGNVLMNLCVNALDAMPEGGHLTLRTRRRLSGQVALSVQDDGHGMSPEVRAKALEPFFTTKPVGKGTGLGLSVVFGTVKAHGGLVELQSTPGEGTVVTVVLPASGANAPAPRSEPEPGPPQGLRVLVVDDDPMVQYSVPAMLESAGHEADLAGRGAEALAMLERGERYDLVLLDMNMPGLSGEETFQRLRQICPEVPVIVGTGFVDERAARILATGHSTSLMPKPYTRKEILAAIQTALKG